MTHFPHVQMTHFPRVQMTPFPSPPTMQHHAVVAMGLGTNLYFYINETHIRSLDHFKASYLLEGGAPVYSLSAKALDAYALGRNV